MTADEIERPALRSTSGTAWWSVERVLYGLALVTGAWLRLWRLGAQPLSPWEASNSWPAWLVANGLSASDAPAPTSALYYSLQWLLFWTGVNSDAGARFLSAIAGIGLVILPWWWRGFLGRRVALFLSFLIAIDPWLLGFSRMADGAVLALTLGMLTLVALSQVAQQPHSFLWKRVVAISFGLLIVSGAMGWNFVPVALWCGWLLRGELSAAGMLRKEWLLWAVGAAFAGATLWFARLDAIAWIASGMSLWLSQFDGTSAGPLLPPVTGGYELWWPWLRLFVDSALLLLLGIGGLAVLAVRARRSEAHDPALLRLLYLCCGWLLWGVLLWLLPGRSPLALPVVGLPLMILAAYSLDALIINMPVDIEWREASAVVITLIILIVSGSLWLTALLANRNYDPVLAQAALVIFGLALMILIAFGWWANRRDALWIGASLLSVLLLLFYIRGSWKLNFPNVITEPAGWMAWIAHPEVRLLARDMETLSSHRSGDPYQHPVQVQVAPTVLRDERVIPARPDPVVGWELRNMRNLRWVTAPLVEEDANPLPLVVTPAIGEDEAVQLALPAGYAGSRYHVDSWWLPETLVSGEAAPTAEGDENLLRRWMSVLQPWWRWFIYREATVAPQNRDVILWAPLDISAP